MNILGFLPDPGGCGWYRQRQPLWWLDKIGHHTRELTPAHWQDPDQGGPELLRWADVIVVARLQQVGVLNILRDYNPRALLVYDIDDDLLNAPSENPYSKLSTSIEHEAIRSNMQDADLITVSTKPLQEKFREYNDNIEIVPNCIDPFLFSWPKIEKDHLRVGWAGSSTHARDIEPAVAGLKMALDKMNKKDTRVLPVFMGHLGRVAADKFKRVVWQQPVLFNEYYLKLHGLGLDVALAPIRPHPFNEAKSDVKFLEYSGMGAATSHRTRDRTNARSRTKRPASW